MRILHLTPAVGQRSGGQGTSALSLAHAQQVLGHASTIWCLDAPSEASEVGATWGLEDRIVATPVLGPSMLGYSPVAERMAGGVAGAQFDVLHQHGIWTANSRVTNRWRATFGRPTVIAPRGTLEAWALRRSIWKKRLASLGYEATNLRLASCLHATAESEATSFRDYGLRNPIAVIPNAIPDTWLQSTGDGEHFRRQHAISADKRLLLFLSRIHPKKGLPLLFEALAQSRQHLANWQLVIAGPNEVGHQQELLELADKLGIHDLLQFVGPLFGNTKRDAFAAADLFVLPTHSENFANVIAEALGVGVPVLTTHGTPWHELETHRCGWWVPVSVSTIQEALLDAIRCSKTELVMMGERGKALIGHSYTLSQTAWKTLQLYNWLVGRDDRPDFVLMM